MTMTFGVGWGGVESRVDHVSRMEVKMKSMSAGVCAASSHMNSVRLWGTEGMEMDNRGSVPAQALARIQRRRGVAPSLVCLCGDFS